MDEFFSICKLKTLKNSCALDITMVVTISILILVNIGALIHMFTFYKRIKFENIVIFFSVIELFFVLISSVTLIHLSINAGLMCQMIITSYINRRFLRIITGKKIRERKFFSLHNIYFLFCTIISFAILTLYVVFSILLNHKFELIMYIDYLEGFFILANTFILTIFGFKVNKKMKKSSKEVRNKDVKKYIGEQSSVDNSTLTDKSGKETFYNVRNLQLVALILGNFISIIYQVFFIIFSNIVFSERFDRSRRRLEPKDNIGFYMLFFYNFSLVNISVVNYIAFYLLIIKEFSKNHYDMAKITMTIEDIEKINVGEYIDPDTDALLRARTLSKKKTMSRKSNVTDQTAFEKGYI